MRSRWVLAIALTGLIAAGLALAASQSGYSGSATYHRTAKGTTNGAVTTGVQGKGIFSGKLAAGRRSLVASYAAAAGIPLGEAVKGGRYAVAWSMANGKIHGTVYAKFKSTAAGSVCLTYVATPTMFDANFHASPPHGTFRTIGGTGKGARTTLSGTFAVGKENYHGEVDRTDTLAGKLSTKGSTAHGLTATCRKLAKAAR